MKERNSGKKQISKSSIIIPTIVQRTSHGREASDLFSSLLQNNNIIILSGEIDNESADIIVAELLYLENLNNNRDISLYINSPGGSVTAGLAVISAMRFIQKDVCTICTGLAASMAAVILAAGAKNKRFSLPYARIMIHQVSSGMKGQLADIEASVKEVNALQSIIYGI